MAYKSKKTEQKLLKPTVEELRQRDALALTQLICDMYQEKMLHRDISDKALKKMVLSTKHEGDLVADVSRHRPTLQSHQAKQTRVAP